MANRGARTSHSRPCAICSRGSREAGPLVLAIDDLHWADVDSLAVLEYLLHGHLPRNVLLILLGRSGTRRQSYPARSCSRASARCNRKRPENWPAVFSPKGRERPFDPAWLAEEAGRHPLFMEAMLRHWCPAAGGGRSGWRMRSLPAKALPARARAVLEVISIASQPLSLATIARATGLFAEPLFKLVRDLQTELLSASIAGAKGRSHPSSRTTIRFGARSPGA